MPRPPAAASVVVLTAAGQPTFPAFPQDDDAVARLVARRYGAQPDGRPHRWAWATAPERPPAPTPPAPDAGAEAEALPAGTAIAVVTDPRRPTFVLAVALARDALDALVDARFGRRPDGTPHRWAVTARLAAPAPAPAPAPVPVPPAAPPPAAPAGRAGGATVETVVHVLTAPGAPTFRVALGTRGDVIAREIARRHGRQEDGSPHAWRTEVARATPRDG